MIINKKKTKYFDTKDRGCITKNISWFNFLTFNWVTHLLDSLKYEDFKLPEIEENDNIGYYTYKLGENLRNVSIKKFGLFNYLYRKGNSYTYVKYPLKSRRTRSNECYIHYSNITFALIRTFKYTLILISLFNILHTLYYIFVARCVEKYVQLIKDQKPLLFPIFSNHSKLIYGFVVIILLCFVQFFDAALCYYYYRLRADMEITVMYFLYKINLSNHNNNLMDPYTCMNKDDDEKTNTSYCKIGNKNSNKEEKSIDLNGSYGDTLYINSSNNKKDEADQHKDLYLNTKDYYSICFNNEIYVSDQHLNENKNHFVKISSNTRTSDKKKDSNKADEVSKKIIKNNNYEAIKSNNPSDINEEEKAENINLKKEKEQFIDIEKGDNYNELITDENILKENVDTSSNGNDVKLSNNKKNEKKKKDKDILDLNIYNIMFVDTPCLVYFLTSLIDLFNLLVKFIISFYIFYLKMGSNAALNGALSVIFIYGAMLIFEFISCLFKRSYLKYRDMRIGNMHHVLKEFKLMKIFNWEYFAFDYVNFYRKKEMNICKIRIYLSSLSNYLNTISSSLIEVVLFFLFIRSELKSKKTIDYSSIIFSLFLYKSLISEISNFLNIMNNLIEGVINIKRINRYIYYYLYYNDINNYFRYFSSTNSTNSSFFIENMPKNEATNDSQYRKSNNKEEKKKKTSNNFFSFLFFNRRKKTYAVDNETFNNLNYDAISIKKVKYSNDAINCTDNYNSIYLEKKNNNKAKKMEDDVIIKLENCYFTLNKESFDTNDNFILKNINFILKNNTLSIILGNVGSGKTIFFQSLLGDFKLGYGKFYVKNLLHNLPILYLPQYTWVSIGTVRSMILFGNPFDEYIYYHAILQSELLNDIISFKNKDMRYVNDEHNLSGGQKTRICLARALYHHYIHMKELTINYEKEINENKKIKKIKILEDLDSLNAKHSENDPTKNNTLTNDKDIINQDDVQKNIFKQDNFVNNYNNTSVLQNTINAESNTCGLEQTLNCHYSSSTSNNSINKEDNIFNNIYTENCLRDENMSYLYLLDDVFSGLDPCRSKNIFYNLFCDKEKIECFKNNSSFVISMNENIFESFITDYIINNLQYKVNIYKLENSTLHYEGEILEYIKKNNIHVKSEVNLNNQKLTVNDVKQKLSTEEEECNDKQIDMKYNKYLLLKQLKTMYSFKVSESDTFTICDRKDSTTTTKFVQNELLVHEGKDADNKITEISIKEKNSIELKEKKEDNLKEFEKINKILSNKLKNDYYIPDINHDNENELQFKGNIKLETFTWYLRRVGFPLISIIVVFMTLSLFTEEIKNLILFMVSTVSKKEYANDQEVLNQQMTYLKYFLLFPSISLGTTLVCFMLIAHGIVLGATKIHTEVLYSILYAPIHVFYSNNLGNIINRFITDISVLDDGILKRIYKTFYTFFRFISTAFLLIYMIKSTLLVFPFILLVIYFAVFKRYSKGSKEAQRGYLSSHAPLCNMYSNTILGKNVINLYKKNDYFLKMYERRTGIFRNYIIFKLSLTIWASLYVQLIVLLLTLFYIIYSHIFFKHNRNMNKDMFERNANTIGYCITFSCSLGYIIKSLLYNYTHVEKEMCSTQRLEECSKIIDGDLLEETDIRTLSSKLCTQEKIQKKYNSSELIEKSSGIPSIDNVYVDESKLKYGIHFENVFVSYKKKIYTDKKNNIYDYVNEKSCLKNINIYALKSQKIGIVGKSGSGKSTLILSVLGLIPTTKGKITIEGKDIRELDMNHKKCIIGVLPQSSFVFFNWNVRTFIDPYKNFTDEEMVDAFKLIGLNLSYKDLDKYIYKQRKKKIHVVKKKKNINLNNFIPLSDDCIRYLSLVRLFLNRHKYKLILIDEIPLPKSNNNNMKMNDFFMNDLKSFDYIIRNYFKNTTVLIIAHDANTLSCCDFIYVIRKGEVVYRCSNKDIKTQAELANILDKDI